MSRRDERFVTEHRGGPLGNDAHYQVMSWACACAEHVLHLFGGNVDERLRTALRVADDWRRGNASVGEARKASLDSIAVAREAGTPAAIAVARSVGHAVATAHMADHSLGAAYYALKAVKSTGELPDAERRWQDDRLTPDIRNLVLSARKRRKI